MISRLRRLRLVDRDEFRYLQGVERSVARMQRQATRYREDIRNRARGMERQRQQIRSDQAYIDRLEEHVPHEVIRQIRDSMRAVRTARAVDGG